MKIIKISDEPIVPDVINLDSPEENPVTPAVTPASPVTPAAETLAPPIQESMEMPLWWDKLSVVHREKIMSFPIQKRKEIIQQIDKKMNTKQDILKVLDVEPILPETESKEETKKIIKLN